MEVVNGLLRGTIEIKRAELILRALNTAVRNSRRVKFGNSSDIVTEIPDYATPPAADVDEGARAEAERQATHTEIARVRAPHLEAAGVDPTQPKPPVSDRSAEVLQSRKQRASSG
jgi:hypothetical protein